MLTIRKMLMIFLIFVPSFLDMISCNPIKRTIQVYSYNGENFILEQSDTSGRYSEFIFPNVDTNLEGYTFLGWIQIEYSYDEIYEFKTLEELENYSSRLRYNIDEKLPVESETFHPTSAYYYPLMVKNELLQKFFEESPLAEFRIQIVTIKGNQSNDRNIDYITTRLNTTYQEVLKDYLEIKGYYNLIGVSDIDKENYLEEGFKEEELISLSDKIDLEHIYSNEAIYIYFEEYDRYDYTT